MPPKSRKKSASTSFASTRTPQQAYFPPQLRTILGPRGSTSTPKTKQQTLTQIDFVTRNHDLEDGMGLDYEEEAEAPRPTKRRRVDNRGQTPQHYTSSARDPKSNKKAAGTGRRNHDNGKLNVSKGRARKAGASLVPSETRARRSSKVEAINNNIDNETRHTPHSGLISSSEKQLACNSETETPRAKTPLAASRKRRNGKVKETEDTESAYTDDEQRPSIKNAKAAKIPQTQRKVSTRASTRRSTTSRNNASHSDIDIRTLSEPTTPGRTAQSNPEKPVLPPSTPKWVGAKVVPSSQSPTESIMSTQSPRAAEAPRTPLKQLSRNIRLPKSPATNGKFVRFPGLEVRDTFNEETSSQISTQLPNIERVPSLNDQNGPVVDDSSSDVQAVPISVLDGGSSPQSQRRTRIVKTEILDSDEEGGDMDDTLDEFAIGENTQVAFNFASSSSVFGEDGMEILPAHNSPDSLPLKSILGVAHNKDANGPDTKIKSEQRPSQDHVLSSPTESEQVAAQLNDDLTRASQHIPGPFTSLYQQQSSEPDEGVYMLPPPLANQHTTQTSSPRPPPPVPTSQATTVYASSQSVPATTPATTAMTSSGRQSNIGQSTASRNTATNKGYLPARSPLPPMFFSSSPAESRKVVWDGKPMTDSQMLPDSLMNFEFPRILSQDSLVEEEREE